MARFASARPERDRLPGPDLADASTPEPTTFSAAISLLAAEQHRVIGERPGEGHPHQLPGAGVERHLRAVRLSARSSLIACSATTRRVVADRPSELVIVSAPGPSLHPPDADGVRQVSGGLGREQQRQAALDRGLDRLAEVHHRARLAVAVITPAPTRDVAAELARRERDHAQLELGGRGAVGSAVGAAGDEQSSPPVALVLRHAGPDGYAELAGELLRELPGGVQALLRPGVQRVHVDPLEQLARGGGR